MDKVDKAEDYDWMVALYTWLIDSWLVVWNMFYFSIYWEKTSQLANIFQMG